MTEIIKKQLDNTYINEDRIIDKYIYFKEDTYDYVKYYIIKVNSIETENNIDITYNTQDCHFLYVPKDRHCKVFCYDDKQVQINYNKTTLYEMNIDEYVNTFRNFIHLDGTNAKDLPDKIICDE